MSFGGKNKGEGWLEMCWHDKKNALESWFFLFGLVRFYTVDNMSEIPEVTVDDDSHRPSNVWSIRFRKSLTYLLFMVFILGGLEWVLRWVMPGFHSARLPHDVIDSHTKNSFRYDPDLMWYWKDTPNGSVNEFGFRYNKPMTQQKPMNVIRAIGFGDSQTYGAGLETEQTFIAKTHKYLGKEWEFINAGISGYRSLNVFRLTRLKMLPFSPDLLVINCMLWDSPPEDGELYQRPAGSFGQNAKNVLWNSRLNYVFQLVLRRIGLGAWEDLPWPIHLHKVRQELQSSDMKKDMGNHEQIYHWARHRGIQVLFMEYAYRQPDGTIACYSKASDLPKGAPVFETCKVLGESGFAADLLFIDTNHYTALGSKVIAMDLVHTMKELVPNK